MIRLISIQPPSMQCKEEGRIRGEDKVKVVACSLSLSPDLRLKRRRQEVVKVETQRQGGFKQSMRVTEQGKSSVQRKSSVESRIQCKREVTTKQEYRPGLTLSTKRRDSLIYEPSESLQAKRQMAEQKCRREVVRLGNPKLRSHSPIDKLMQLAKEKSKPN